MLSFLGIDMKMLKRIKTHIIFDDGVKVNTSFTLYNFYNQYLMDNNSFNIHEFFLAVNCKNKSFYNFCFSIDLEKYGTKNFDSLKFKDEFLQWHNYSYRSKKVSEQFIENIKTFYPLNQFIYKVGF